MAIFMENVAPSQAQLVTPQHTQKDYSYGNTCRAYCQGQRAQDPSKS